MEKITKRKARKEAKAAKTQEKNREEYLRMKGELKMSTKEFNSIQEVQKEVVDKSGPFSVELQEFVKEQMAREDKKQIKKENDANLSL